MSQTPLTRARKPTAQPVRQTEPAATTSANYRVPAREVRPVPSATTSTLLTVERAVTFKVTSYAGGLRTLTSNPPSQCGHFAASAEPSQRTLMTNRG